MVIQRSFGGNSFDEIPLQDVRGIMQMLVSTSVLGWNNFLKQSSKLDALSVTRAFLVHTRTENLEKNKLRKFNFT
jgi:hypothetical protein